MGFQVAKKKFDPDLVVYNAGTDILDGDPLGRLKVRTAVGKQAICGLHVCHSEGRSSFRSKLHRRWNYRSYNYYKLIKFYRFFIQLIGRVFITSK